MKQRLQSLLERALRAVAAERGVDFEPRGAGQVERARDDAHGDFASNIALVNARRFKTKPRQLAAELARHIPADAAIEKIEVAGPGFINFYLKPDAVAGIVARILRQGEAFGRSEHGRGRQALVEFVSANPTGPLHIGHGRGAAYGDVIAALLQNAGFEVRREYYVNDAGRQMDILALSVWLRYLRLCGLSCPYPEQAYQGDYIVDIARRLQREDGDRYRRPAADPAAAIAAAERETADPEARLDRLIAHGRETLGDDDFGRVLDLALHEIVAVIRADLQAFGVTFDTWFSERSLAAGPLRECIAELRDKNEIYERDGASWFAATRHGDEKDRVVRRDNGAYTYFASDIAYHRDKLRRGFDRVVNVWGADHHGYIKRLKAALAALGQDPERLKILLVQFATLYRGARKASMSTRAGQYVALRELVDEVGADAARFFYVMRKPEQHLEFDLELAKAQSNDNPVYYIQYAHARICSVLRQAREQSLAYDQSVALDSLSLLDSDSEQKLLAQLARYEERALDAALAYEPHALCFYLQELAHCFHNYYNAQRFLRAEERLRNSRLALCLATRQVIANGLGLLGVSAPETM